MSPRPTIAGHRLDPMWFVALGLLLLILATFDQSYVGRKDLIESLRTSCVLSNHSTRRRLHLPPRDCVAAYPAASPWPQL